MKFDQRITLSLVTGLLLAMNAHAQRILVPSPGPPWNVNSNADEVDLVPGDGYCRTATGHCTLRAAIQEANARGGTTPQRINLPQNTYAIGIPGRYSSFEIWANIEIVGDGMGVTIISGEGKDRVFSVMETLSLKGVTVTAGRSQSVGGGIFNWGNLVISESDITNNTAVEVGGGIHSMVGTYLSISKSRIRNNSSALGGGIASWGTLEINDSELYGNNATDLGGAIFAANSSAILRGTSLTYNTAPRSGAIQIQTGDLTATNCTFSSNISSGEDNGGAVITLLSPRTTYSIMSSTVTGNRSGVFENEMGGLYVEGIAYVRASIIDQGDRGCVRSRNVYSLVVSEGYSIDRKDSCGFRGVGDKWNTDPLLGPLQNNGGLAGTHALLPGSPAIDAIPGSVNTITPGFVPSVDQRGVGRPQYPGLNSGNSVPSYLPVYDIGAYEVIPGPVLRPIVPFL